MCGIAGYVGPLMPNGTAVLTAMADAIRHRGPDDSGVFLDATLGVGLAHRRLSIVDLSAAGHQPMVSESGRFVIVFNGEIYNYLELRRELSAAEPTLTFRGTSDTEVMLAAFERWGLIRSLEKFNGMFAFALLDKKERRLHLVRDRIGEKPLYYLRTGQWLIFGSELKALKKHPAWRGDIDRSALREYLRYAYVGGRASIYANVHKVQPGALVTMNIADASCDLEHNTYWSADDVVMRGQHDPLELTDQDAVTQLTQLLTESVQLRMIADVPLGAFLSGGIDSSTVVAIMQRLSVRPVRTFSIGFEEGRFNEAESAKAVASHVGTEHVEFYVTPRDSLDAIPQMPKIFDEPFADPSQIPTYLVSRLARQHVTVSLSGDGGDELFCGYERYELVRRLSAASSMVPHKLRSAVAAAIRTMPIPMWNMLGSALPQRITAGRTGDRMYKLAQRLRSETFTEILDDVLGVWDEPEELLGEVDGGLVRAPRRLPIPSVGTEYEQMMALDLSTYLPDDILVKLDRASMAVSLESRVPLLDHRLVEFAWRLPMRFKRRDGTAKWLLKQVLYDLVPRDLVDRPKQGFAVPIEHWLRTELRGWACDTLAPESIKRDGFFDHRVVSRYLEEHFSGLRSWTSQIWAVLMFQSWLHAD